MTDYNVLEFTNKVLESIYHIKVDKTIDSELRTILEELNDWIQESDITDLFDVNIILRRYKERIYLQLLRDNTKSLAFYDRIIHLCIEILNNNKYDIKDIHYDLFYEVSCIKLTLEQYRSLVEYIFRYQEQNKVEIKNDTDGSVITFREFTDFTVKGYITSLINVAEMLDSNDNDNLRKAVYTYLFQCGYDLIEDSTAPDKFVSNLIAIQNSRLFRNREDSIIIVNDAIKVLNIIQMCWFFLYCAFELLKMRKPGTDVYYKLYELLMEFLKNYDVSLLDKILKLLEEIEDENKDNIYQKISEIASASQAMSKITLIHSALADYMDLLDRIQGFIDRLTAFLDKLQINLDSLYDKIQSILDIIPNFLERLYKLLDIGDIKIVKQVVDLINSVIAAINKTLETLNKLACAIRQMLCIIAGFLHFKDTVLGPLKAQLKKLVSDARALLDDTLATLQNLVAEVNNAIKIAIYKQGEMKARSLSYKAGSAIGKQSSIDWGLVFNNAVNVAFGKPSVAGGSVLNSMKSTSSKFINDLKNQILSGLSKDAAVNCPPITLPNLKIKKPNFNMSYSLPKIEKIKTDVRC